MISTTGVPLSLRGVRKVFQPANVIAIESLDLEIPAGQFVSILGPSGCGKSTLLRLIAHLDRPSAGAIHAGPLGPGIDIAYVFQDAHLLPWRTVLRNVSLPLELKHLDKQTCLTRAHSAIAQVGLSDVELRYPAQLSGGMRMRVSLARALVIDPRLLLLDEPFAALDEITRQQLDEQLRRLWQQRGMTVLFVTHSTVEAAFLADRAIVLSRRPARIVFDHDLATELPAIRTNPLRGEAVFAKQTRALYDALERGGAT